MKRNKGEKGKNSSRQDHVPSWRHFSQYTFLKLFICSCAGRNAEPTQSKTFRRWSATCAKVLRYHISVGGLMWAWSWGGRRGRCSWEWTSLSRTLAEWAWGGGEALTWVCSPSSMDRSSAPCSVPARKVPALWPLGTLGGARPAWSVGPDGEESGVPNLSGDERRYREDGEEGGGTWGSRQEASRAEGAGTLPASASCSPLPQVGVALAGWA